MSLRILPVVCFALLFSPVVYLGYKAASAPKMTVQWSGNKSAARQEYERAVLQAAMEATRAEYGAWQLREAYGDLDARLRLHERRLIRLHNPCLPPDFADYRVDLAPLIEANE